MPLFRRRKNEDRDQVYAEPTPTLPTPPEPDAQGRRGVQDHRDYLLSLIDPLSPFGMQVLEAHGMAVCEDIVSPIDLPEFDIAAIDGYAVEAESVLSASDEHPRELTVTDWVVSRRIARLGEGEAIRVDAGRPLPEGADAVVALPNTDRGVDTVKVFAPVPPGGGVAPRGHELRADEPVLRIGQRLGAREVGLLSGLGFSKVLARPRPRIVVISTGAGLVEPGYGVRQGAEHYDAISYLISASAVAEGSQVWRVDALGLDTASVRDTISDQLIRADLILLTTGPDQADVDEIRGVMESMGMCDFGPVAMEPGGFQGLGIIGVDKVPAVLITGDAATAYVTFQTFVRPLIRKLRGATPYSHQPLRCFAATVLRPDAHDAHFILGRYSDEGGRRLVRPLEAQEGGLAELASANCLILLPAGADPIYAGDAVMVWRLDHD